MSRISVVLVLFLVAPASVVGQNVDQYGDPLPLGALARLGTGRMRHGMFVYGASFSPDGRKLISIGSGPAGAGQVSVIEWDAATGKGDNRVEFRYATNVFPPAADVSQDGRIAAAIHSGIPATASIMLIDVTTGRELRQIGGSDHMIFHLAFSPDAKLLASSVSGGAVRLLDVATGNEVRRYEGQANYSHRLAFSPDGKALAAAGSDGTLRVWDTVSGRELAKQTAQVRSHCCAFSPNGKTLVWPSGDTIRLWDYVSGKEDRTLEGKPLEATCLAFTPDGRTLVAGDAHGSVSLWDRATGKETHRWAAHGQWVTSVRFAPDGKTFSSLSGFEAAIRVWQLPDGKEVHSFGGHRAAVTAIRSFSGERVVSQGMDNTVRDWDLRTGKDGILFSRPTKGFNRWSLSPDGTTFITFDQQNRTLHQWDAETGTERRVLGSFSRPSWSGRSPHAFTGDSKLLAHSEARGEIRLCALSNGQELHRLPRHEDELNVLCFSPDGRVLASGANRQGGGAVDRAVRLWDVATGKELRHLEQQLGVDLLVFSPDGGVLAAAGFLNLDARAQGVVLWDVTSGNRLCQMPDRAVPHAFSPDGRLLAVQDTFPTYDATIRLIETITGKEACRFSTTETGFACAAFSPDGRTLATGCGDSSILIWDLTCGTSDGRAKALTGEELNAHWNTLAGLDATAAYKAIWSLIAAPKDSVPFLAEKLKPAAGVDEKHLAQLLAALDSDKFAERENASAELAKLGELAGPALDKLLKANPSQEAKRRAEAIVAKLGGPVTSPEQLRTLRAIEVLEYIGTPEAMRVVEKLAAGATGARETEDAKRTLERLKKRGD